MWCSGCPLLNELPISTRYVACPQKSGATIPFASKNYQENNIQHSNKNFFLIYPPTRKKTQLSGGGWVDPMYIYIYTYVYTYTLPSSTLRNSSPNFPMQPPPRCQGWIVNAIDAENLRLRNLTTFDGNLRFRPFCIPQKWIKMACW